MEERHKYWSRELSKSFIFKILSNKKLPDLLRWKAHSKWTLSTYLLLGISTFIFRVPLNF